MLPRGGSRPLSQPHPPAQCWLRCWRTATRRQRCCRALPSLSARPLPLSSLASCTGWWSCWRPLPADSAHRLPHTPRGSGRRRRKDASSAKWGTRLRNHSNSFELSPPAARQAASLVERSASVRQCAENVCDPVITVLRQALACCCRAVGQLGATAARAAAGRDQSGGYDAARTCGRCRGRAGLLPDAFCGGRRPAGCWRWPQTQPSTFRRFLPPTSEEVAAPARLKADWLNHEGGWARCEGQAAAPKRTTHSRRCLPDRGGVEQMKCYEHCAEA